jgi:CYTH domain-containing protein
MKYVVSLDTTPEWLVQRESITALSVERIDQVYLDDGIRLRHSESLHSENSDNYVMAYKRRTTMGPIEIEADIIRDDFDALLEHATRRLDKHRHTFLEMGTHLLPELDIYRDEADAIFLMVIEVEYETTEIDWLDDIEAILGDRIVAKIDPATDDRLSNFKLADRAYAKSTAAEIYANPTYQRAA